MYIFFYVGIYMFILVIIYNVIYIVTCKQFYMHTYTALIYIYIYIIRGVYD